MAGTLDSQLQVQACISPVFINAVEQDLARTTHHTPNPSYAAAGLPCLRSAKH
jgi:hypothetical protein